MSYDYGYGDDTPSGVSSDSSSSKSKFGSKQHMKDNKNLYIGIAVVVFITTITIITGCFVLEYHLHSHHRQIENLHLLDLPSLLVIIALICFKPRITRTS